MSFITKRDRVFNYECNLFDLPSRNEGKLKAYASCTDARAWSHFCSDKTEHLVEIIKRNNEKCRPKYVPTEVIVNTLMIAKNTQINRLKRTVEELEQLLAAYDQLELTADQKSEIASAHATIKAASKELDDMCLDLDLSGFTEGIDSETFETGKSRGDEASRSTTETAKSGISEWYYIKDHSQGKMRNNEPTECCDVSTCIIDSRVEELQDMIVSKDAKMNAMQNTIAVLENDICEPYCIYAQIYTALEKIFGILRQNLKYRQYLDLLTVTKNLQHINLKGKILYKIKILEKFSLALIAPCNEDNKSRECSCYHAEVMTTIETTYALTTSENLENDLDNKRAHLVADIVDIAEMKEILSKESENVKACSDIEESSIRKENINRLKNLQVNYDDLMTLYENLKTEKDVLYVRCQKLSKLEEEYEKLQNDLKEYNQLWNEKEHFRKRSANLDKLKETYYLLLDETSDLESKVKAESEISKDKSDTIKELRNQNFSLEKKLEETKLLFEKEKNALLFKLKESECNVMCKEQQIKSLSSEIEKILEQNANITSNVVPPLELLNEIASQKEEIVNLKETCKCNEEEQIYLQQEFNNKLEHIYELMFEVEAWKSKYEDMLRVQEVLNTQVKQLDAENQVLKRDVDEEKEAVVNLYTIIENKSDQINNLTEELEQKNNDNNKLLIEIEKIRNDFKEQLDLFENKNKDLINYYDKQSNNVDINNRLNNDIAYDSNKSGYSKSTSSIREGVLSQIKSLCRESLEIIAKHDDTKEQLRQSLQLTKKESADLENKVLYLNNLTQPLEELKSAYQELLHEKETLENDLQYKSDELLNLNINLLKTHKELEKYKEEYNHLLSSSEKQLNNKEAEINVKEADINNKDAEINKLQQINTNLEAEISNLQIKCQQVDELTQEIFNLKLQCDNLMTEKENLTIKLDDKVNELNNITQQLEKINKENSNLVSQIKILEFHEKSSKSDINLLKSENLSIRSSLSSSEKQLNTKNAEINEKEADINNKDTEINKLQQINTNLEAEISNLQMKCQLVDELTQEIFNLKLRCDDLMTEKENLIIKLDGKANELNNITKQLEQINKENSNLVSQLKILELHQKSSKSDINLLKSENLSIRSSLDALSKDNSEKSDEIIYYKNIEVKYNDISNNIDKLRKENQMLNHDFRMNEEALKSLENKNKELEIQNHNILSDKEALEILLQRKEQEVVNANFLCSYYEDIKKEIDIMKKEKNDSNEKIIDLMHKLQNSERLILDFKDDIIKRDNTISELQNHINSLQEEIKELHNNLEIAIVNGEDISRESLETIDKSVKKVEAHYSRATHNMKIEIAKLQKKHDVLKNKDPKTKHDEFDVEKHRHISQVMHLQNEREKVLNKLNELEIKTLGFSNLTLNSTAEDIMDVLDNIRKVFDDKNTYYEQKLLNTQNSYELLKNKAEEAKKIVEFEKQKIINEKEINKQEQINIERKLLDLHNQLKSQEIEYKDIIRDLEAKMLNQKLIFDQINESNKNYIKKLKEEVLKLKEIYEQAVTDIEILKKELQDSIYEKKTQSDKFNDLYNDYEKTCNEIEKLQKLLKDVKNKITSDVQLQTEFVKLNSNKCTQTDTEEIYVSENINVYDTQPNKLDLSDYNSDRKERHNKLIPPNSSQKNNSTAQEVQILTAKIEPSIDFVKNIYQNYVIGRLQTKAVEQYSVSALIPEFDKFNNDNSDIPDNYQNSREIKNSMRPKHLDKLSKNSVYDASLNNTYPDYSIKISKIKNLPEQIQNESDKIPNLYHHKELAATKESSFTNPLKKQLKISNQEKNQVIANNKTDKLPIAQNSKNKYNYKNNITLQSEYPSSTKEVLHKTEKSASNNQATVQRIQDKLDTNKLSETTKPSNKIPILQTYSPLSIASSSDKKSHHSINMYMSPRSINYSDTILFSNHADQNIPAKAQKTKKELSLHKTNIQNKSDSNITENDYKTEMLPSNASLSALPIDKIYNNVEIENVRNTINHKRKDMKDIDKYLRRRKKSINALRKSSLRESQSCEEILSFRKSSSSEKDSVLIITSTELKNEKTFSNKAVSVNLDIIENYEMQIKDLYRTIEATEKKYEKKIEAMKLQYENYVKGIINEHNQGVKTIQSLHEDTVSDIFKIHDIEIENLRTMSIDAMTKAEKLQKENKNLKLKLDTHKLIVLDERHIKLETAEPQKRKSRSRACTTTLTKTNVVAFNVKPKEKCSGPCTCSLDINISDTIRNIFEQVDVGQRKLAEHTYLKYIANKLIENIESLNAQELAFLHLKVCRIWKNKLTKEEALKWKIDALESELMNKQLQTQKHISELDRKVIKEQRRLREVRKVICRNLPTQSNESNPRQLLIPGICKENNYCESLCNDLK